MNAALVAVAHGSRDPRSAAVVTELVEVVGARRPGLAVRLAFLDLSAPRLPDVLAGLAGTGQQRAVVVPLLLGWAYHARVDVPGALARAGRWHPALELRTADVLGPDERLAALARWRVTEAGGAAADAVVL
ncbi:MAG: sirohydrochlorin chelatase, partial [Pseudonocardiaceae bacterium]